ncbi:SipW-cognate class signal peptide [uncultured Roseburia sp.]|uniref:SipW-dependent-type signal peptide-containing protein n=1 Tax=Brotonthovivens ammoniilytica TaxID=2981725 RepID=A0ABT2TFR0_9FIRM|nr:SipW-dependent-type signal peptide-containing protein [Brotonthovivens ammoniilytica]MCU6761019.1 SipW-dependent-type signal peptide-containing protein [Brotonthovivens ammoniilytica]SCI16459.1 SipW-cognate class signal peptide [uncultured Roseburia sp.]
MAFRKALKKNKKSLRFLAVLFCAVSAAGLAGGTMAYLTDHKETVNTFTVGKVSIEGEEPGWDPDGNDDPGGIAEDIVPTQSWRKDPQIRNVGKNDAYVYMEVSVPMADVIYTDASGKRANDGKLSHIELFEFDGEEKVVQTLTDGIGISEQNDSWTLLYKKEINNCMVYTFCFNKILKPEETSEPLFHKITFANVVEGQLDEEKLDVKVGYYAIQTLNTGGDSESVTEQAKNAYDKYIIQNLGQEGTVVNTNGKEEK